MPKKNDSDKSFIAIVVLVALSIAYNKFIAKIDMNEVFYVAKVLLASAVILCLLVLLVFLWWKRTTNPKEEKPKRQYKKKVKVVEEPEIDVEEIKEEPKKEIEKPKEIVREKVVVRTELEDINFHNTNKLNDYEIDYLKRKNFKIRTYTNPFNRRKQQFIFKPCSNESDAHCIITNLTANYLKKQKIKNVKTFQTAKPDVTFEIKKKKYAIEVETGKILTKSKKQLQNKIELLNKNYDVWFFVVIKRNFVARYRKFGKVIDARYLKNQLNKLVSK